MGRAVQAERVVVQGGVDVVLGAVLARFDEKVSQITFWEAATLGDAAHVAHPRAEICSRLTGEVVVLVFDDQVNDLLGAEVDYRRRVDVVERRRSARS